MQHLHPNRVVAVEWRWPSRASRGAPARRLVEPQPQVQGVYRAERRVGGLVFAVHLRRGEAAPRGEGEGLPAEASYEALLGLSFAVGLNVSEAPGDPEGRTTTTVRAKTSVLGRLLLMVPSARFPASELREGRAPPRLRA